MEPAPTPPAEPTFRRCPRHRLPLSDAASTTHGLLRDALACPGPAAHLIHARATVRHWEVVDRIGHVLYTADEDGVLSVGAPPAYLPTMVAATPPAEPTEQRRGPGRPKHERRRTQRLDSGALPELHLSVSLVSLVSRGR